MPLLRTANCKVKSSAADASPRPAQPGMSQPVHPAPVVMRRRGGRRSTGACKLHLAWHPSCFAGRRGRCALTNQFDEAAGGFSAPAFAGGGLQPGPNELRHGGQCGCPLALITKTRRLQASWMPLGPAKVGLPILPLNHTYSRSLALDACCRRTRFSHAACSHSCRSLCGIPAAIRRVWQYLTQPVDRFARPPTFVSLLRSEAVEPQLRQPSSRCDKRSHSTALLFVLRTCHSWTITDHSVPTTSLPPTPSNRAPVSSRLPRRENPLHQLFSTDSFCSLSCVRDPSAVNNRCDET